MAYLTVESGLVTGAGFIFNLKELLKSAGYVVLSSGTGTSGTYNASGDDITNSGTGTGGMARNRAWFRLRSPDGVNEWLFQRDNTNQSWRVLHNLGGAGFVGGSPSEAVTPDSANQVGCFGGGTGESPTFAGSTFLGDSTFYTKALVDNAAPYGWWASGLIQVNSLPGTGFVWDPIAGHHPEDSFNFVFYGSGGNASPVGTFAINYGLSNGAVSASREFVLTRLPSTTLGAALHCGVICPVDNSNLKFANFESSPTTGVSSNPITSKEFTFPVMYGRNNAVSASHFKGISTMMRFRTTNRSTGSVLDFGSGNYGVVMRDFILPWDKATFAL